MFLQPNHKFLFPTDIAIKENFISLQPTKPVHCYRLPLMAQDDRAGQVETFDETRPRNPVVRAVSGKAFTEVTVL